MSGVRSQEKLCRPDEIEQVAYDTAGHPDRGYTVRASYLKAPRDQSALIEIFKDGKLVREYLYPAYRIYNVAAHFDEIVDEMPA